MYNGIGLQTSRGSGTSGYVQRNLAFVRPKAKRQTFEQQRAAAAPEPVRRPNAAILEHERLRKIESLVFEHGEKLRSQLLTDEEIDSKCAEMRAKLMKDGVDSLSSSSHDSHAQQALKATENEKLRQALGLKSDRVEGAAFDFEGQEAKRQERLAAKAATGDVKKSSWLLRDNRPREDRPREDRPREDRPREDRSRDSRDSRHSDRRDSRDSRDSRDVRRRDDRRRSHSRSRSRSRSRSPRRRSASPARQSSRPRSRSPKRARSASRSASPPARRRHDSDSGTSSTSTSESSSDSSDSSSSDSSSSDSDDE